VESNWRYLTAAYTLTSGKELCYKELCYKELCYK